MKSQKTSPYDLSKKINFSVCNNEVKLSDLRGRNLESDRLNRQELSFSPIDKHGFKKNNFKILF